MKLFWKAGFGDFERIYGFSFPELEKKLDDLLKAIQVLKEADIEKLSTRDCG